MYFAVSCCAHIVLAVRFLKCEITSLHQLPSPGAYFALLCSKYYAVTPVLFIPHGFRRHDIY